MGSFKNRAAATVTALAGIVGMSAGVITVLPGHAMAAGPGVTGTYQYRDSFGDNESLKINTNGTVAFSTGCLGVWVRSGSSFAMDIDQNCGSGRWVFTGVVTPTGLSSKAHPGHLLVRYPTSKAPGTWYASK
jgi:hypothetical protein